MIQRIAQAAVVVIFNGNEPEWLQHSVGKVPHRAENFGHAVHRTGLSLESNFDKVALGEGLSQTKQSASYGNGLQVSFGATSVFQTDGSQNGISELDPGRAPRGVRLGEVGHRSRSLSQPQVAVVQITDAQCPNWRVDLV